MTPGTIDPIRWSSSLRGWSHDRRPWLISRSRSGERGSGHPRPAALRLPARRPGPAPPALAGWMASAWVVRGGWVSRGRLAAAASVTGAPALLVIGPRWPLAGLPETSRSIGASHHRLAALARSRPVTTTWSRVARCHRWNRSGLLCDGAVGGLCAPGCAGVSAPAPLSLARQVRSGLVDAANEPAGSSICRYTTRSCC
jgi:hypothetical protein